MSALFKGRLVICGHVLVKARRSAFTYGAILTFLDSEGLIPGLRDNRGVDNRDCFVKLHLIPILVVQIN